MTQSALLRLIAELEAASAQALETGDMGLALHAAFRACQLQARLRKLETTGT